MLLMRPLRRLLVAPLIPFVTLSLITALPLVAIVAAAVSAWLPGRWRPLRLLWLLLILLAVESLALVGLLVLWLTAGFGRRIASPRVRAAHVWLVARYLSTVVRVGRRVLRLAFDVDATAAHESPLDVAAALRSDAVIAATGQRAPLIVLSRHAGPGDSFLLVHALLAQGFRPRIVLREVLQWAPALDIVLNRLPNHFVTRGARPGQTAAAIAELAGGMGPGDALVLFPEGQNFTLARRRASIARLEQQGRHAEAEQAREMRHVLMPRVGGAVAAISAAPEADIIFVAHTGLEDLSSLVDVWRGIPMDTRIRVKLWRVPAADVPHDDVAAAAWLHSWWRRIDAWILANYGREVLPDAVVDAVEDSVSLQAPDPDGAVDPGDAHDAMG
jgi:1-acyl-sn-glycerol-3-phosphate acyltransferase